MVAVNNRMLSVQSSFYVIIPIILAAFIAVMVIEKMPEKKGKIVLLMMLAGYMAVYSYVWNKVMVHI